VQVTAPLFFRKMNESRESYERERERRPWISRCLDKSRGKIVSSGICKIKMSSKMKKVSKTGRKPPESKEFSCRMSYFKRHAN